MVNVCAADPRVGELREELLRLVGVLEPAVHVPLRDGEVRLVDREDQVVLCPRNVLRPMFVLTVFLTVDSFFFLQTLRGPFSAVSTPNSTSKYSFESSGRDLQDLLIFAPLRYQNVERNLVKQ